MSINSPSRESNNFYKIAEKNYGRNEGWTKSIKALMEAPEAIVSFHEIANTSTASKKKAKEINWTVFNGPDVLSSSIPTHFYDRLVHIFKCIFIDSYCDRFHHAVMRLHEAMIQHNQADLKNVRERERNRFIEGMAPKTMKINPKVEETREKLERLDAILKEKQEMHKKIDEELASYCNDQRITRPCDARKEREEEKKMIFQNITPKEVAERQKLEEEQARLQSGLENLKTQIQKQAEQIQQLREEIAGLSSHVKQGLNAGFLSIGALFSSQKQAEKETNEALSENIRHKQAEMRQFEQGLEEFKEKEQKTEQDLETHKSKLENLSGKLPEKFRNFTTKQIHDYIASNAKAIDDHEAKLLANDPVYAKLAKELQVLSERIASIETDTAKLKATQAEQLKEQNLLRAEIDIFYQKQEAPEDLKKRIESFTYMKIPRKE